MGGELACPFQIRFAIGSALVLLHRHDFARHFVARQLAFTDGLDGSLRINLLSTECHHSRNPLTEAVIRNAYYRQS